MGRKVTRLLAIVRIFPRGIPEEAVRCLVTYLAPVAREDRAFGVEHCHASTAAVLRNFVDASLAIPGSRGEKVGDWRPADRLDGVAVVCGQGYILGDRPRDVGLLRLVVRPRHRVGCWLMKLKSDGRLELPKADRYQAFLFFYFLFYFVKFVVQAGNISISRRVRECSAVRT